MNIWEFLGLNASHRPASKTTMLVKHLREVSDKNIEFPMAAQLKVDGVHCLVVAYKGDVQCFTRTGNMMTNVDVVRNAMVFVPDGVYMGELTTTAPHTLEELSGVVNPNRTEPLDWYGQAQAAGLFVQWFDWVPIGSFISGGTAGNWLARHEQLTKRLADTDAAKGILPFTLVHDMEVLEKFAQACIDSGEEGACFRNLTSGWEAGHKNWKIVKVVRDTSYDLMCVGVEDGKGKAAGMVANFLMQWQDGEVIKVPPGKGWDDVDKKRAFEAAGTGTLADPIGKVYRVTALRDSSKGKLRLPKCREHRHDKLEGDF